MRNITLSALDDKTKEVVICKDTFHEEFPGMIFFFKSHEMPLGGSRFQTFYHRITHQVTSHPITVCGNIPLNFHIQFSWFCQM